MKNYNQFINEEYARGVFNKVLPIGFKFVIDFSDAEPERKKEFIKEIRKYFYFKNDIILTYPAHENPWGWSFEISISPTGGVEIEFNTITSPKNRFKADFFEKVVTLDEFLMVGFEGIKNFIKLKKDADKYNM